MKAISVITLQTRGIVMRTSSIETFVHDSLNITINKETFLQANASELFKNLEEMFPQYYMHSDLCSSVTSPIA